MGQCTVRCPTDTAPGPFCRLAGPKAYSLCGKLAAGRVYPGGAPGQVGPEGAQRTRGGGLGTGTGQGARGRAAGRIRDPVALLQGIAGGSFILAVYQRVGHASWKHARFYAS